MTPQLMRTGCGATVILRRRNSQGKHTVGSTEEASSPLKPSGIRRQTWLGARQPSFGDRWNRYNSDGEPRACAGVV